MRTSFDDVRLVIEESRARKILRVMNDQQSFEWYAEQSLTSILILVRFRLLS